MANITGIKRYEPAAYGGMQESSTGRYLDIEDVKSLMDNYPDDVRQYDKHPLSPFFVEPEPETEECHICGWVFEVSEFSKVEEEYFCDDCLTAIGEKAKSAGLLNN